jgi:hypothetical protein
MKGLVQYFYLSPTHCDSNRVLEVLHSCTHDRAPLGLGFRQPGATNQLWAFIPRDDGYYEIVNKHSRKVLDDSWCGSAGPGGSVYQFERHLGANQQWRIKQAGKENHIQIFSRANGDFVLDVAGWSQEPNAQMVLWQNYHNGNQIWRLIRA